MTSISNKLTVTVNPTTTLDDFVRLTASGAGSSRTGGFVWMQDVAHIFFSSTGWYKGWYTYQNNYSSTFDVGGYVEFTNNIGEPIAAFTITGTNANGYTLTKLDGLKPLNQQVTALNNSLTPSDVYNKTGLGINVRVLKMGKLVSIIWAGTLTQSLPVGWTTIVSDLPVSYFARSPFCEFITTTNGKQYSIEITNNGAISSLRFYPRGSAIDSGEFIQGTITFFCN